MGGLFCMKNKKVGEREIDKLYSMDYAEIKEALSF